MVNIYFHEEGKLRHEQVTDIEDIQRAMSISDDDKHIDPSDFIYGDERKKMRFGNVNTRWTCP